MAPEESWFKSSYSSGDTGNCVEVADLIADDGTVRVRDSKDKAGPALTFSPGQWTALVSFVRTDAAVSEFL
ncbi:DUF397 domain-containing protein [Streptantibioticus silvisoli]|uniref:DUF397 domain-containing protein n=1 Tax=Streptantibioticus silvisoli TaxID=2705255 RepID=A0ABT6W020_9ACTN|nr:DUF397 domain-containing protein [Streptantibioticus silvisoli]MDI5964087.1 DUF397 domain-containing protein [Streptantibioticus silvisoli]